MATVGEGNVTVGGEEAELAGLNRDTENTTSEIYDVDRQQGNIDLTVDHRLLSEEGRKQIAEDAQLVAEVVVAVKREIQTWGDQAPKDIQVFIPGIEGFIEEQIRNGADIEGLIDTLQSPEFKAAAEKLQPLVELVENNPELLQEALTAAKEIQPDQITVNADGLTVVTVTGNKELPVKTEVLHAMGVMNQAVETVMQSKSGQMVQLLGAALGGLPRLVAGAAVDQIVGDELAELQTNIAVAIGAWGTDRTSAEFSEDVTDEQLYKHQEFFQTVEGGGSLTMTLAAILITGKVAGGKKDGERQLPFNDKDRLTEINKTLDRVENGGPFPYGKDGTRFGNNEGLLPKGNYLEYTVDTPGAANRGARRIVVDKDTGKTYYTDDHYKSFVEIDPNKKG